jgi:hypothetical protein
MKGMDEADDPRRRLLIQALAAGMFTAGLPGNNALAASIFGSRPHKLPPGQSIYFLDGEATVNGKTATIDTKINPGDTVQTGKDSELIFVVNTHSMLLRANSHLVIEAAQNKPVETAPEPKPEPKPQHKKELKLSPAEKKPEDTNPLSLVINGLRMLTGKLLTVSRNTPMRVLSATATIGIRGTGFYLESDPELTYFCTCYGVTDVEASADPESKTTVVSYHHNRPLYILKDQGQGNNIRNAPFVNHTDQELTLIEALVGRTPPFVFSNDAYSAPRRDY